jgi:hypothetical protein
MPLSKITSTYQMSDYFERGPGRTRLGPARALAAVACRTAEDHVALLVVAIVAALLIMALFFRRAQTAVPR